GDEVQDPAEQPARSEPQSRSDNEPQYPSQDAAIVNLPEARKNQTQNAGYDWVAHRLKLPPQVEANTTAVRVLFVQRSPSRYTSEISPRKVFSMVWMLG